MRACLDSSFLIDYRDGEDHTVEFLEANPNADYHIPVIVLYELYSGAIWADSERESRDSVDESLQWANHLPQSRDDVREAAEIKAELMADGTRINEMDVLIAGVARNRGLAVIANDRDYEQVDNLSVIKTRDAPGK